MKYKIIKVLVAESLHLETLRNLARQYNFNLYENGKLPKKLQAGLHFVYQPDIIPTQIENDIGGYDCLVVRPKQVSALAINNGNKLKLIVRGGAGLNSIDLEAAKTKNVAVKNTPGMNAASTAEYTFNLIMRVVANRHIEQANIDARNNTYKEPEQYEGRELEGKKLAIIGLGNIGIKLANMALGFSMQVSAFSRTIKENADKKIKQFTNLNEILAWQADIISLHVPLEDNTKHMVDEQFFAQMKKGSVLINCARPQLICPKAFSDALASGVLSSFAIDGDYDLVLPFIKTDSKNKGIITHHIADSTYEAQAKITTAVVKHIVEFFT